MKQEISFLPLCISPFGTMELLEEGLSTDLLFGVYAFFFNSFIFATFKKQ